MRLIDADELVRRIEEQICKDCKYRIGWGEVPCCSCWINDALVIIDGLETQEADT